MKEKAAGPDTFPSFVKLGGQAMTKSFTYWLHAFWNEECIPLSLIVFVFKKGRVTVAIIVTLASFQ